MTDIEKALASHRRGRWGRRYRLWWDTATPAATVSVVPFGLGCVSLMAGGAAAGWWAALGLVDPAVAAVAAMAVTPVVPVLLYAAVCLSGLLDWWADGGTLVARPADPPTHTPFRRLPHDRR